MKYFDNKSLKEYILENYQSNDVYNFLESFFTEMQSTKIENISLLGAVES